MHLSDWDFVSRAAAGWLLSASSTITYGNEHFKAAAAPTLIRPSLQTGDAEAAPVRVSHRQSSICLPRCGIFCFVMEMYQDTFKFSPALTRHSSKPA